MYLSPISIIDYWSMFFIWYFAVVVVGETILVFWFVEFTFHLWCFLFTGYGSQTNWLPLLLSGQIFVKHTHTHTIRYMVFMNAKMILKCRNEILLVCLFVECQWLTQFFFISFLIKSRFIFSRSIFFQISTHFLTSKITLFSLLLLLLFY